MQKTFEFSRLNMEFTFQRQFVVQPRGFLQGWQSLVQDHQHDDRPCKLEREQTQILGFQ